MNKSSWADIEAGLKSRKAPPPRHDAGSFREDFKAHAALMRQDSPNQSEIAAFSVFSWRAIGAAAAVLLLVGGLLWPTAASLVTHVKSLQVMAPHSGVIIMTDDVNQGTVVWVTDLESGDESKG